MQNDQKQPPFTKYNKHKVPFTWCLDQALELGKSFLDQNGDSDVLIFICEDGWDACRFSMVEITTALTQSLPIKFFPCFITHSHNTHVCTPTNYIQAYPLRCIDYLNGSLCLQYQGWKRYMHEFLTLLPHKFMVLLEDRGL